MTMTTPQPSTKYKTLVQNFALVMFGDNITAAIASYKDALTEMEATYKATEEALERDINADLAALIANGLSSSQAMMELDIDVTGRQRQLNDAKHDLYLEQVAEIDTLKSELRQLIGECVAFQAMKREIEWYEGDMSFYKTLSQHIVDFFGDFLEDYKDEILEKFELLFDALYFCFEDNVVQARIIKALISVSPKNNKDVKPEMRLHDLYRQSPPARHNILNDYFLGVNDQLFEHLKGLRNASEDAAKDSGDPSKDWFRRYVIEEKV